LEDVSVVAGLWAALNHPVLFLAALALFLVLLIWLLPKLWRGIKRVFGALARLFGAGRPKETQAEVPPDATTPSPRDDRLPPPEP
jgi:hypothetical protein